MKIDPQIISQAAEKFDLKISDLNPLGGMEGMALAFKRSRDDYVLKITPKPKGSPTEVEKLEGKLEFIHYLAKNGVRVAKPIPSPAGNWVETVETSQTLYLVNTFTKANGEHLDLYKTPGGNASFFQAWGQVTGQMHRLAKTYKYWQKKQVNDSHPRAIDNWQDEHRFFSNWCQYDEVRAKWVELGNKIEKLPQTRDVYGLIHNDLHPWNMIVNIEGDITVIDFDVCAFHFFIKDIAIALFHVNWSGNPGKGRSKNDYLTRFFHIFMEGYSQENSLDGFWFEQLPTFISHHHILLFIVFTDEWRNPNKWQLNTLDRWKDQIINDKPAVRLQF
jgi:Ser/Thr protein kinase RdoA (MazF antagonist)